MKLLVVEDEVALADALSEILKRNKYAVDTVYDGEDGLDYAMTGIYDCIILDIMLPKMNGIEVLGALRKGHISTPVLLLTAKSDTEDKIKGLDAGADDYLTKPFVSGELLARVRSLTRRRGEVVTDEFTFGDIALNKSTFSLSREGQFVKLSLKEYQIMEMLMANPRQLIPKERFIEKIWGYESDVEYNNVEVYISFLRKKIAAVGSKVCIKTARGIGYFLEGAQE
ncbi:MAG: response regulator transcription factor [Oscillospiraceae bacterium]|nr:response regulator transcription factor [Oscillospiraceae bacterium]MBQ9695454.1 response regulator transcription factor [Oscillospiraceae bacterium]MBR1458772.1 response regulator transcription factor [Oscillospiraceae bacterium]MBR1897955.1 response regulator transcription factor [Oscillospiraceae bacterium]